MSALPDPRTVIHDTVTRIAPVSDLAAETARARHGQLTKPPGSLGRLEDLAVRIAAIRDEPRPRLDRRLIVVAAADHGVTARGVSAYPAEVTAQMVANFLAGGAAINVLADHAGARVRVVDAGVATDTGDHPALETLRLGRGTADITAGPAMPQAVAERALAAGIAIVEDELDARGLNLVGCGEMGIGNTTAAAAIVAAVSGRPPIAVTGRGTGIDDATHARKVEAIETALRVNHPDPLDGVDLLAKIGGFEIGLLAGVYLGAAARRVPAIVDGLISGAAALIAVAIEPRVRDYLIASHRSVEPGHTATLEILGLDPLLELDLRLGEGTGAALGMTICVAACRVLDEMATFAEAGVSDSDTVIEPEG
ncbi:MAG: nicotinate-nucleotide--dimethylbenzimidazole phosphoribosyltransferase [Chloroflexi bacterium]|nr:nicotinate-nucleotide--dimethylbenzimidazole phosphoribosyltransferase [Chloroflexota bacterium]MDA1145526.1 nicotinate-nucleotide--dimethylbenzimidazole phosphoribosyltransferase [Chloroflexota bacterium]